MIKRRWKKEKIDGYTAYNFYIRKKFLKIIPYWSYLYTRNGYYNVKIATNKLIEQYGIQLVLDEEVMKSVFTNMGLASLIKEYLKNDKKIHRF